MHDHNNINIMSVSHAIMIFVVLCLFWRKSSVKQSGNISSQERRGVYFLRLLDAFEVGSDGRWACFLYSIFINARSSVIFFAVHVATLLLDQMLVFKQTTAREIGPSTLMTFARS